MPKTPKYRQRKGRDQALVTLTDAATKRRKDYWLGPYGSAASREMYHRVIAAWEANGRRWPRLESDHDDAASGRTRIKEIVREYWHWATGYYREKHVQSLRGAVRMIRKYYGGTRATDFGPNKLRLLRQEMIRGDANEDPPRKPWCRKYVNAQVGRIRHMFKWAAARELVPASIHQSLCTLEPLKRGRAAVRESKKVEPVPPDLLKTTLRHLTRPARAVVEVQLLTGARPGELLALRRADIEMDGQTKIWTYKPEVHKNAHREKERVIYFGPRAQGLLTPFLANRPADAYLFSPAEADSERREALRETRSTPLSCGNRAGTNCRSEPKRQPGDRYSTPAYHRAIQYACDRAFPPTGKLAQGKGETKRTWVARLKKSGLTDELKSWRKAHRWHPHQLRHNAATLLRRQFGLEAAQLALGHASAQVTDAVYAERDCAKVIEIMRRIG